MPYPVYNIPFNQWLNYTNNVWVTNGEGDITGVIGNNVVNALYQYILTCPFNYQKGAIVGQNTPYTVTNPITVFFGGVPSSVTFGDNFYNEWLFLNATNSNIYFSNGLGYFDVNFTFTNFIPPKSVVRISKLVNNQWIQTSASNGTATSVSPLTGVVGGGGSDDPINGISTFQSNKLIGLGSDNDGKCQIEIDGLIQYNFGGISSFDLNNSTGVLDISPNIFVTDSVLYIDLNQ